MTAPTRPITAVIVSNIAKRPLRPCGTQDGGNPAQSKRFPDASAQSGSTEDFAQQVFQKPGRAEGLEKRDLQATIDSPRQGPPHFRRVPVAISLRVDAEVGCVDRNDRA